MDKNSKIKDIPLIERPREKLKIKGTQNLKDAELLAVLLGTGYQGRNVLELAKFVLNKYPKKKFINLTYEDLMKVKGISDAKACNVLSAIELVKRLLEHKDDDTLPIIKSVNDVVAQSVYMRDKVREHLMVIYLNARNEMIFKRPMFTGTLDASLIHPREIFSEAVRQNAASIILVHNHPSGDANPSENDISITDTLVKAGEMMGIEVLDHVIIARNKVFSFKKEKLI